MVTSIKGARGAAAACVLFVLLGAVLAGCAREDPVATALARVTAEVGATGTARAQAAQATVTAAAAAVATRASEATAVAMAGGTATAQARQEATQAAAATGTAAVEAVGTRVAAATQMARASRATATAAAGAMATAEGVAATAAAETTRAALLAAAETADRVLFTSPDGAVVPEQRDDLGVFLTGVNARNFVADVALTVENKTERRQETLVSLWFRTGAGLTNALDLGIFFLTQPQGQGGEIFAWSYRVIDEDGEALLGGDTVSFQPAEDGAYHLRLIVVEESGLLTVNGEPVAQLDASARTLAGGVMLGAFFGPQQRDGNVRVHFRDFVIRGWE